MGSDPKPHDKSWRFDASVPRTASAAGAPGRDRLARIRVRRSVRHENTFRLSRPASGGVSCVVAGVLEACAAIRTRAHYRCLRERQSATHVLDCRARRQCQENRRPRDCDRIEHRPRDPVRVPRRSRRRSRHGAMCSSMPASRSERRSATPRTTPPSARRSAISSSLTPDFVSPDSISSSACSAAGILCNTMLAHASAS